MKSVWERELSALMHRETLIKLEEKYGGQYLYIPSHEPTQELVKTIGSITARALTYRYGGSDIYIPKRAFLKDRNNRIVEDKKSGTSIIELAAKYRIKTRTIKLIIRERRKLDALNAQPHDAARRKA